MIRKEYQTKTRYTLILTYKKGYLYAKGDTYYVKENLKMLGFRWDPIEKRWYIKTTDIDNDYVDKYIKEIKKFAEIKFSSDSEIIGDTKTIKTKEKDKVVEPKNEVINTEETKKNNPLEDILKDFYGNLYFASFQNNNEIEENIKNHWTKKESRFFSVFEKRGERTFYAIFDTIKNMTYILRDDTYEPGLDLIHESKIENFLQTLNNGNLDKEEASKRLEEFIHQNYMPVSTAKEIFEKAKERKKKIEEQTSMIPRKERIKQLSELFKTLNDKDAYLLPELEVFESRLEIKEPVSMIIERAVGKHETQSYKGIILWKVGTKYVLFIRVLNKDTFVMDSSIYMLRDDSQKIEEFLKGLDNKQFSVIADEVEKYLKENFNYKEFNYKIDPYIEIEILYNEEYIMDGGEEKIDAIIVTGYTDLVQDILRELGFRKDRDEEWIKYLRTKSPSEAEEVKKELVEKLSIKVKVRIAGGNTEFGKTL